MSKWSSFEKDHLIMENWRKFSEGKVEEQQVDEIFGLGKKKSWQKSDDELAAQAGMADLPGEKEAGVRGTYYKSNLMPATRFYVNFIKQAEAEDPEIRKKANPSRIFDELVDIIQNQDFEVVSENKEIDEQFNLLLEQSDSDGTEGEDSTGTPAVNIKTLLDRFATFIQRTGVLNEKINYVIQALKPKDTKVFGKSLAQNFKREEIEALKSHFEDTENGALFFKQYFRQSPEFLERFNQVLAGAEAGTPTVANLELALEKFANLLKLILPIPKSKDLKENIAAAVDALKINRKEWNEALNLALQNGNLSGEELALINNYLKDEENLKQFLSSFFNVPEEEKKPKLTFPKCPTEKARKIVTGLGTPLMFNYSPAKHPALKGLFEVLIAAGVEEYFHKFICKLVEVGFLQDSIEAALKDSGFAGETGAPQVMGGSGIFAQGRDKLSRGDREEPEAAEEPEEEPEAAEEPATDTPDAPPEEAPDDETPEDEAPPDDEAEEEEAQFEIPEEETTDEVSDSIDRLRQQWNEDNSDRGEDFSFDDDLQEFYNFFGPFKNEEEETPDTNITEEKDDRQSNKEWRNAVAFLASKLGYNFKSLHPALMELGYNSGANRILLSLRDMGQKEGGKKDRALILKTLLPLIQKRPDAPAEPVISESLKGRWQVLAGIKR
jgi:hypothetical protein